jgi:DNA-binding transcriptional ArsR family regulator
MMLKKTWSGEKTSGAVAKPDHKDISFKHDVMLDRARQASEFLKALSHESRLMILCLLCEGEKSVSDLEALLSLRQSAVSQHLARLRLDGLVEAKREGKTVYYSLANDDLPTILAAVYEVFCKKPRCGARS